MSAVGGSESVSVISWPTSVSANVSVPDDVVIVRFGLSVTVT